MDGSSAALWGVAAIAAVVGFVSKRSAKQKKDSAAPGAVRKLSYQEQVSAEIDNITNSGEMVEDGTKVRLPVLSPSDFGYRPVGKENLLGVMENVKRLEMKSNGTYRTKGFSVSIPIVKGLRYRVGSGSIRSEKTLQVTAVGRLILTDKAVSFESNQQNERITWTQIASVELMTDGFQVAKRSGPPRLYQTENPDAKFAAAMRLMALRDS